MPGRSRSGRQRAQLSGGAVVPRVAIEEFEAGGTVPSEDNIAALRRALEQAGVSRIEGDGLGFGAGGEVEEMTKTRSIAGCAPARVRDFYDIVLRSAGQ
jgi:hypothetical protein